MTVNQLEFGQPTNADVSTSVKSNKHLNAYAFSSTGVDTEGMTFCVRKPPWGTNGR